MKFLQTSFNAGILSPSMYGRVDFDRFSKGCRILKNFIVHSHGGVSKRPGMQYCERCFDHTKKSRLIEFEFSTIQAYAMEFSGAGRVQFFMDGGQIQAVRTVTGATQTNPVVVTSTDHGFFDGQTVEFADVEGMTELNGNSYTVANATANTVELAGVDGTGFGAYTSGGTATGNYQIEHPYSETEIFELDYAQSADTMYITHPNHAQRKLTRADHDDWTLSTPTFTDAPSEWTTDDYPSCVTFFEGRLVFAGSPSHPQRVWLSKSDSFEDFGVSTPVVDGDACTYTISADQVNAIKWLKSASVLVIGTTGGEWWMRGATTSEPITPSSILARRVSNYGSQPGVRPQMVGDTILFVERHGRSVRELIYDETIEGRGTDLSLLADHLTESNAIIGMVFQRVPDRIAWCWLEDGSLIGLTYQREHQVVAPHTHTTGQNDDDLIESACVVPGTDRDELYLSVARNINGETRRYVERLAGNFVGDDTADATLLDSYLHYEGAAASIIYNVGHLEGEEVQALVDGAPHPDYTVAAGEFELQSSATKATVGIGYSAELETMDFTTYARGETIIGEIKDVKRMVANVKNSLGMQMGSDENNLEDVDFRTGDIDLMDNPPPLFTGPKELPYPGGFADSPRVFIRQEQPLPLTVLNIMSEVEVA